VTKDIEKEKIDGLKMFNTLEEAIEDVNVNGKKDIQCLIFDDSFFENNPVDFAKAC
jgi:hypothetical protein